MNINNNKIRYIR